MEMIFHSHVNKTHFHKKGCALGLFLKVRVFGTRNWPIHFDRKGFALDISLVLKVRVLGTRKWPKGLLPPKTPDTQTIIKPFLFDGGKTFSWQHVNLLSATVQKNEL